MSRNRWGNGATPPPVEPVDGQLALVPFERVGATCCDHHAGWADAPECDGGDRPIEPPQ